MMKIMWMWLWLARIVSLFFKLVTFHHSNGTQGPKARCRDSTQSSWHPLLQGFYAGCLVNDECRVGSARSLVQSAGIPKTRFFWRPHPDCPACCWRISATEAVKMIGNCKPSRLCAKEWFVAPLWIYLNMFMPTTGPLHPIYVTICYHAWQSAWRNLMILPPGLCAWHHCWEDWKGNLQGVLNFPNLGDL